MMFRNFIKYFLIGTPCCGEALCIAVLKFRIAFLFAHPIIRSWDARFAFGMEFIRVIS